MTLNTQRTFHRFQWLTKVLMLCVALTIVSVAVHEYSVFAQEESESARQQREQVESKQQVIQSSRLVVFKAKLSKSATKKGLPPRLWLGIRENKEWQCFHQHAWGDAMVSTRQDFGDRYPVQKLRMRIDGPHGVVGDLSCENCSQKSVDNQYFGTDVCGDFSAGWLAVAADPNYGSWQVQQNW